VLVPTEVAAPISIEGAREGMDVLGAYREVGSYRVLPAARAAGSARNFLRLVAEVKQAWRQGHHRGRGSAARIGDI
jgi:formate-dependent phosphoribosylglycinamide formyltransferase (GAR transformylase)